MELLKKIRQAQLFEIFCNLCRDVLRRFLLFKIWQKNDNAHVIELIWKILEKTQTNFLAKILKNAKYFLWENTKKRKVP